MDSTGSPQRVILVGIDEAGFGPILGPLIVSSSAFMLPHHLLTSDLWQVLRKSVANKRKRLAGRLLVADSKKAHNKSLGIKHLQRTVLSCLKCLGKEPKTLQELLTILCPDCLNRLSEYPWHQKISNHIIEFDRADMAIASSVLADDLSSNGIELLELKSCCLDVAFYNKMVNSVKNKASVLFTATSQLIKNAFDNFKADDRFGRLTTSLQFIIDRQGGRTHYRKVLLTMFPDAKLKILREPRPFEGRGESQTDSSYELKTDGRYMRLHFVVRADDNFLPVSLASMVSKYVRELLVYNMNRYFVGFYPDLKPTAGYWKDGLRFIKDIQTNPPRVKFDANQLIRSR